MSISATGSKRAWRTAVLGGMASYMDAATIISTGTALVLYKDHLGLSSWTIGFLSAMLTLGLGIGALLGGRLGDLLGRRRVFTYDLVVFAAGLALLAFAVNSWMLCIGVAVTGLAMGADIPTSLALVAEEAPEGRRSRMVAASQALWSVGGFAAYLIGYLVSDLEVLGARILYSHVLVVSLVVLVLRSRLGESEEWRAAHAEQRHVPAAAERGDSVRHLLAGPMGAAVIALGLFYAIGNLAANTFGQFQTYLFTEVAGAAVSTATLVGMLAYPVGICAVLFYMRNVEGPARMSIFTAGIVLMAGGAAVTLVFGLNLTTLVILKLCVTIGSAFAGEIMFKVWAQEFFPTLLRGTAQGVVMAFTRLVSAGFALVTPRILDVSHDALIAILLVGVLISGLVAWLWIVPLARARKQREDDAATLPATAEAVAP
ncbi:MFS transporter [Streptomyces sp. NPDC049881]|uniref:MFS transporter n=1 Tax=Streptomyces sp. NPDC049881 TaxID=3155778 RepID=UPI00343C584C